MIESPVLEMLLIYKPEFQNNPSLELRNGYSQILKTKNIEKAKGLELEFSIPTSWSFKEGKRPHVLYLFSSKLKSESGTIEIHSLSETIGVSKEELNKYSPEELADELLTKETMEAIPNNIPGLSNLKIFEYKRGIIDRCFGATASFVGTINRMDFSTTQYQKSYILLYKDYMINYSFVVFKNQKESDESFQGRIEKYSSLYKYIMNTLVIQSQYKK